MNLYKNIEQAIRKQENNLYVGEGVTKQDVHHAIQRVMRDNPDIFWFSYQWSYYDTSTVSFHYPLSKNKVEEIQKQIDDVINNDFQIAYARTLADFEKVAYVYKWIVQNCNYNINSAYNQSIYSVFVLRNSVCSGYAKAAQYLFNLLDINCQLIYGEIDGGNYHGRHCWDLIEIAGDYYHLDICFGDSSLDILLNSIGITEIQNIHGINYNFFCVSTEEILKSRSIENINSIPVANKTLPYQHVMKLAEVQTRHRSDVKGVLLSSKGSTADIYLCSCDKNVVLKLFRPSCKNLCVEEYRFMDRLRECPHLLHVKDKYCAIDDSILAIEQSVSVKEIIASPDSAFSLKDALTMVRDIAWAVDECYWNNTYYVDIHLNNVYKDSSGTYKLGDFGSCIWADQINSSTAKKKIEGSLWFMAPETYSNCVFNLTSATYSLSMLLYFILNGLTPPFWNDFQDERANDKRLKGCAIPPLAFMPFEDDICNDINRFLEKGLSFEEKKRLRDIQEYVTRLERLIIILGKRDYTLQFGNLFRGGRFNKTVTLDINKTVTLDSTRIFDEENIRTRTHKQEECDENKETVTANIFCPYCGAPYSVEITRNLADNIKPMLRCNAAYGGLNNILRTNKDYVCCPTCGCRTTVAQCLEMNALSLSCQDNRYTPDDSPGRCIDREERSAMSVIPTYDKKKHVTDRIDDFAQSCCFCPEEDASPRKEKVVSFQPALPKGERKMNSLWKKWFSRKNKSAEEDLVYSSIFAPAEVKRKSHMQVQVYLHLLQESERVKALAKESDRSAERRDYIPLQSKLKTGDKVDVILNIFGKTLLRSDKKNVVWQGSFTKCSFDYFVPQNIDVEELSCAALLSVNGVPVGEMRFITQIVDSPRQLNPEIISHKYNKVFISYSHLDEPKVKFLHEGLELGAVPHFFDRKYLKVGDVFPQVIQDYINSADLFILCWSENASKSEYVQKERMQALGRAFPQIKPEKDAKLRIYPMSIEPRAALPTDMKDYYHFGEM